VAGPWSQQLNKGQASGGQPDDQSLGDRSVGSQWRSDHDPRRVDQAHHVQPAADNLLGLLVALSIGGPFFRSNDDSTLRRGGSYLKHRQLRGEDQGHAADRVSHPCVPPGALDWHPIAASEPRGCGPRCHRVGHGDRRTLEIVGWACCAPSGSARTRPACGHT
jgi:hypothetical protein